LGIHGSQLVIDPPYEIAIRDIPNEQEQTVIHLVQPTIAQRVAGQGASIDVVRFRARVSPLLVLAIVEPPRPA
jgi:hypothetical protein